ncbi:F-box/FBD/LRR-repeat protein At5g56420-like [Arabidopsis lyrata subsp. lyrata]|uniref:F-box/FBD/LRR-repeat protein At5g56420-like n=1 Tax=Arabidopsis lyrata subsp. lyrata TaxID=81972 RepID=UPI000A29C196|nr:F-box/FBD/LRR-repeat protein At5g56420-like [Arabidopsis lyrata subsp. lyrata]|eukprot:XP_020885476.1 F-box/FBD/LRR-repeat protein At5g56420-like [Arabidopsis lyrata subsp. lyrata]
MSMLSKRWKSLWTLVPRLIFEDYSDEDKDAETKERHWRDLSHFVYGTLLYHKAPVLETFHLNVASDRLALEVDLWIRIAVERFVRDLKISFNYDHGLIRLPSSFFRCETLETLELHRVVLLEVPSRFSFRSLRTLRLRSVKYSDEELFCRIISCCPVLEDLDVESCNNDNVATFTVNLLSILDYCGEVSIIGNMPELVEANLQTLSRHENVLKSLNSIRRLSLCLDVEAQYPTGSVFFQLNHWMAVDRKGGWIQPSFVPECLLLNIKTFEWRDYEGREEEKQMAMYILKNARRLLTATIDLDSVKLSRRLKVIEELVFASRGSRACKLTVC